MEEIFEWDPQKAKQNLTKHDVSFEEAQSVFFDQSSVTIADPDHSIDEIRIIINGYSIRQRQLVVIHTDRDGRIRIISARTANRLERNLYEQENR